VVPQGRHTIWDYAEELDFASSFMLRFAGPPFGIVWSDLDKGCGHVAMAGQAQGKDVIRVFQVKSTVSPHSTRISDTESDVDMRGKVTGKPQVVGEIALDSPAAQAPHGDAVVRAAFVFMRQALPSWRVVWCRQGVVWPVAVLHRQSQDGGHWLFVQIATHLNVAKAYVDLSLSTAEIKAAMRVAPVLSV